MKMETNQWQVWGSDFSSSLSLLPQQKKLSISWFFPRKNIGLVRPPEARKSWIRHQT